jgi:hypothetical protein
MTKLGIGIRHLWKRFRGSYLIAVGMVAGIPGKASEESDRGFL